MLIKTELPEILLIVSIHAHNQCSENLPMVADLHHLQSILSVPNRMRSDFPFGMVRNASYTTIGGSKLGVSSNTNAPLDFNKES